MRPQIYKKIFTRRFCSSSSSIRAQFDIPRDVAYLNCAYLSPLSKQASAAGIKGLLRKTQPWTVTKPDFYEDLKEVRELFGTLIGADSSTISVIPSASYGICTAAKNIRVEEGQRIVILGEEHASNRIVWQQKAREAGAELVVVNPPCDGSSWTTAVCKEINSKTALVAVVHTHWTDGTLLDLQRIAELSSQASAALVIDGTQSIGALEIPPETLQKVDFLVVAAYKWLMCPYGIGFMYSSSKYHTDGLGLESHGWNRAHEEIVWGPKPGSGNQSINDQGTDGSIDLNPHEIDGVLNEDFAAGATRFDVGETSNFISIPACISALSQLLEWGGPSAISERLEHLTSEIASHADMRGYQVPEIRAPHLLGIKPPQNLSWPEDIAQQLGEKSVFVARRGNALRIAPHLYNDSKDIEHLFRALDELNLFHQLHKETMSDTYTPGIGSESRFLHTYSDLMVQIHVSKDFNDVNQTLEEMISNNESIDAPCLCLLLSRIIRTFKTSVGPEATSIKNNIQQLLPRVLTLMRSSRLHLQGMDADNLCQTVVEVGDRWDVIDLLNLSRTHLAAFHNDQFENLLTGPCLRNSEQKMHVPIHQTVLQTINLIKANKTQQDADRFSHVGPSDEVHALRVVEDELSNLGIESRGFLLKMSESVYF